MHPVRLSPGAHDPMVVPRDDNHVIHALGLELVNAVEIGGDVLLLTGWRKRSWDGNKDNLLVLELCVRVSGEPLSERAMVHAFACVVFDGQSAGRDFSLFRGWRNVCEGDALRKGVSGLELRHAGVGLVVGEMETGTATI